MRSAYEGGEWFLATGVLLLFSGLILWAVLPGAGFPPLLSPAVLSIIYGGYCVWYRGQVRGSLPSSSGRDGSQEPVKAPREMLMMVRRRKAKAKR